MDGEKKSMLQGIRKWRKVRRPSVSGYPPLPPSPHPHPPSPTLPIVSPLSQPAGAGTYIEDVGSGWQRELHTIDDEREGGQALDVATVHEKLQRGTGPRMPHLPPERTCQPHHLSPSGPGPEPQACFGTGGCNTNTARVTQEDSRAEGGIWGHLSISLTPKHDSCLNFPHEKG